ncbi:hypothetical protein CXB51_005364 [Gossypium anomalum]|uniref:Uncharacterized protein n=1 Tax=Gossypium anomalum TaxID=47600 RepID=A0A8J6D8E9_9ROSI|nr:hypothetical protein CXB51_005364 [Gossypium anomalum]
MNVAAVAWTVYVSIFSLMAPFPPFPDRACSQNAQCNIVHIFSYLPRDLNFVEQQVALVGKRVITTFNERIEGLESFERNQVFLFLAQVVDDNSRDVF